jgi:hypothetical protein
MSEINASRLLDPGEELIWSGRPNAVWFAIRRLPWWPLLIVFIGLVVSISLSFEAARLPAPTNPKSISPLAMARAMREMAVVAALFSVVIALWLIRPVR